MKQRLMLLVLACSFACTGAQAVTLRVANQGDAQSMDPHSLNESLQLTFTNNVYEPLIARNKQLGLIPGLATRWSQPQPTVWRFELRRGVSFHDGTAFTADDVVFSFNRAGPGRTAETPRRSRRAQGRANPWEITTTTPFPSCGRSPTCT